MAQKKHEDSEAASAEPQLPEAARAFISLFLVLHLFIVFTALMAGVTMAPSPLQTRFLSIVRPYVRGLNFELQNAHLNLDVAYGGNEDADYRLEYSMSGVSDEQTEPWQGLPDVGSRASDRYHRYQRLNRRIAILDQVGGQASAPMQAAAARLVQGVATRLSSEEKIASGGRLRCRRRRPIFMDAISRGNQEQINPNSDLYVNDAYSATVLVDDVTGKVFVNKDASSREVAQPGTEGS